jgi:phage I-like protein
MTPEDIAASIQPMGYLVDLSTIKLDESGVPTSMFQAYPHGEYSHPIYGKLTMDSEKAARMAEGVNQKVRGQDLDIDYDHKQYHGAAAGWVKAAESRPDGLWLTVEWTPDAAKAIKNREYRYFSPEFASEWKHPKTGEKYKDVLFGGAITNRPFLKDILPINLSEAFAGTKPTQEAPKVDEFVKQLAALLGLPDDSTSEKVLSEFKLKLEAPKPEPKKDEPDPTLVKLAETNPAIATMLAEQAQLKEERKQDAVRLAALEMRHRLSETKTSVKALSDKLKGFEIAPAHVNEMANALVKCTEGVANELLTALSNLFEKGLVQLTEIGGGKPRNIGGADPIKQFTDAIDKKMTDNKGMQYSEAVRVVAEEDPKLWENYSEATLAGVGEEA